MLRGTSRRTINHKKRKEKIKQEAKKLIINVRNNSQQHIQDNDIAPKYNHNLGIDTNNDGIIFYFI
jgi:hypothetical protein